MFTTFRSLPFRVKNAKIKKVIVLLVVGCLLFNSCSPGDTPLRRDETHERTMGTRHRTHGQMMGHQSLQGMAEEMGGTYYRSSPIYRIVQFFFGIFLCNALVVKIYGLPSLIFPHIESLEINRSIALFGGATMACDTAFNFIVDRAGTVIDAAGFISDGGDLGQAVEHIWNNVPFE